MKKTTLAILLSMILTQATYAAEENSNNIVNITINKISEGSGLELGTNARARGEGAIATGSNSLAIGKNAVATGGNETQESISKKLAENTQKLNDIETAKSSVDTLLNEIQTLRTRQADVIEAGERVKQVIQAKATAKADWKAKQQTYQDAVANNAAFLQEVQGKLDDLNSRLAGMSRIENVDISSDDGLNQAVTKLKAIVEDGTTLNLTDSFYKEYVKSYYASLGDIRKVQQYTSLSNEFGHPRNLKFWYDEQVISDWNAYSYGKNSKILNLFPKIDKSYQEKNLLEISFNDYGDENKLHSYHHDNFSMYFKNINSDITDENEYQQWQSTKEETKADYLNVFLNIGNGLFKIADDPFGRTFFENQQNLKLSLIDKAYEITYYQWKYEQTKDTTWLDKKANLIKGYKELVSNYNKLYYQPDSKTKINDIEAYFKYKHNEYVEKNINSITEKNRITTDKLTQDLEAALNINKNAVKDKEKEIAKLKSEADQAKANYESINPTEKDNILGGEYENIMRQLTEKSAELAQSQQKLQALEESLTLHDLTDVGQSAIAIGTNTLATGSNATSIGTETIATGENAVAIGKSSTVTGSNSIAVGTGHLVAGHNSGSFGDPNVIYGDNSYAVGNNITIGEQNTPHTVGQDTFVLGSDINTTANNAVILGVNSVGQDNTVSVGSFGNLRKIINVEKGILAQNSNEVITGGQLYSVLQDAAEVNISNWQRALGTGSNVAGNRGLITGNTLHSALEAQRTEINNNLANIENTKANKDASNLSDEDKSKWQEALGTGKSESGNKGLISGDTLNAALSTKADKSDITNINTNLDNKANKTEVVALKTELTTNVTKITSDLATKANIDASNIDTAKFAEKLGVGTVSENDTNLVTGRTVYAALSNLANNDAVIAKANKDASNLSDEDKSKWQEALGTGTAEVGNTGLINGDTLHTELEKKADKSDVTNITTNLTTKANNDASNISTDDAKKWAEKLGTGTITKGDISLVTGDTVYNTTINKANTDMDNLTDTGKTVIQNLAKGSVKVIAGTNTTVTTSKDGDATTYAVNVSKDAIKAAVQGDLDAKANKDASNISTDDAKKWAEKLGTGTVSENDSNLVSGKTVYAALSNLANNDAVISKANKDASNLSDEDKSKWQEALGTGTAEAGNKGLISGDTLNTALSEKANKSEVNQKLESKADKDASNIDVAKYTEKLNMGRIELNNKGLINGGQVHGYVQNYVAEMSGRTLAQANAYTDYRIGSLKAYTDKRLNEIRDEARAGVASAMAMGAIPSVPNKRFSIGAGTATYHSQNAIAIGLKVKTENDKAVISLSGSASSNGDFGAAAGFAFGF
ncbi:YadA-like family protein [Gallibacterium anatis]|uniref:YadA-like family protein n=1 Tax=Gallibacterium anatis TaxID=750 RepID=UPI00057D4B7F|nr:YadA-like family protein [Gallibacterium anatis]